MNIKEIENILCQKCVSEDIKERVLIKSKELIKQELEVEVIVSPITVMLDVYDEGVRVEKQKIKLVKGT